MPVLYMWIYWINFELAAVHQSRELPAQKAALHFIDFSQGRKLCAAVFTCEIWRSAGAATCRGPAEEPSGVIINPKGSVETDGLMVEDRHSSQHTSRYFHWFRRRKTANPFRRKFQTKHAAFLTPPSPVAVLHILLAQ